MVDRGETKALTLPASEATWFSGAEDRIARAMWTLGVLATATIWLTAGSKWAGGFAIGAAFSGLSFYWIRKTVMTLSEMAGAGTQDPMIPARQKRPSAAGMVFRLMLRYAFIGVAGYGIFKSSFLSLDAFFLGLFLLVGAILVEAVYEVYSGLRNG